MIAKLGLNFFQVEQRFGKDRECIYRISIHRSSCFSINEVLILSIARIICTIAYICLKNQSQNHFRTKRLKTGTFTGAYGLGSKADPWRKQLFSSMNFYCFSTK